MIWTETLYNDLDKRHHTFIINSLLWTECNHFTFFVKEVTSEDCITPICKCFSFRYNIITGQLTINFKDPGVRLAFMLLYEHIISMQKEWSAEYESVPSPKKGY